jgi:putative flippase GtrA
MLALPVPVARALAIWVAMTWNFYWNRRWTFFESRRDSLAAVRAVLPGVPVGCRGKLDDQRRPVAVRTFFANQPLLAAVLGVAAGMAFNFVASCKLVFRRSADPR